MRHDHDDLDQEIRGHLALSIKDRVERGADPASARLAALKEFGNVTGSSWSKSADDRLERCRDEVERRWPHERSAQVYLVEDGTGDEVKSRAEKLWYASEDWPDPLVMRLATRLHELYEDSDEREANFYAWHAAIRGNSALVADGAKHMDSRHKRAAALKLVRESEPAPTRQAAKDRLDALLAMDEAKAARQEMERSIAADVDIPAYMQVKIYLADHDLVAANKAGEKLVHTANSNAARFDLALANGDIAKARGMVSFDDDFNTWIKRYSKVVANNRLAALAPSMLPFTLILLFLVAIVLGILALPFALVHHRGLVLRLRHRTPKPMFEGIGLRHAWIALCICAVIPMLVAIAIDPVNIEAAFVEGVDLPSGDFLTEVLTSMATALVLLPWMARLRAMPVPGQEATF